MTARWPSDTCATPLALHPAPEPFAAKDMTAILSFCAQNLSPIPSPSSSCTSRRFEPCPLLLAHPCPVLPAHRIPLLKTTRHKCFSGLTFQEGGLSFFET